MSAGLPKRTPHSRAEVGGCAQLIALDRRLRTGERHGSSIGGASATIVEAPAAWQQLTPEEVEMKPCLLHGPFGRLRRANAQT